MSLADLSPAHQAPETPVTVNPAPVALLCHALTATVFGVFLLSASMNGIAAPMAIGFGGFLTMLSGLFEYTRGRTFSFTYLVGLGCFWMCLGIFNTLVGATPSAAMAWSFALWGIVAIAFLYPAFHFSRVNGLFMLSWVLMCAGCCYYYATGQYACFAAITSFICAAMGFYKAYAHLAVFAYGREILPLGRTRHEEGVDTNQDATF